VTKSVMKAWKIAALNQIDYENLDAAMIYIGSYYGQVHVLPDDSRSITTLCGMSRKPRRIKGRPIELEEMTKAVTCDGCLVAFAARKLIKSQIE